MCYEFCFQFSSFNSFFEKYNIEMKNNPVEAFLVCLRKLPRQHGDVSEMLCLLQTFGQKRIYL